MLQASGPPVQMEPVDLSMKTTSVPGLLPIAKFISKPTAQNAGKCQICDINVIYIYLKRIDLDI